MHWQKENKKTQSSLCLSVSGDILLHDPFHGYVEDSGEYHQLIIRYKAVSCFDFADSLPLNGDAVELHTGGQVRLREPQGGSCLMDTVAGDILLSVKVVDLQGSTPSMCLDNTTDSGLLCDKDLQNIGKKNKLPVFFPDYAKIVEIEKGSPGKMEYECFGNAVGRRLS